MKLHSRLAVSCIVLALASYGPAHAEDASDAGRDEVASQPWIGSLGVRFHSENLFEETALASFPGDRGAVNELSGQAGVAGLQGLGLVGDWRPFRNGFRLSFAMYLDQIESGEPGGSRSRKQSEFGPALEDLALLPKDFEAVPYVGLGWQTNGGGLDVNLDVGAFLPGDHALRDRACMKPDSPLTGCDSTSSGSSQGKLSGSFRDFEWYPVVSLGIEYRF